MLNTGYMRVRFDYGARGYVDLSADYAQEFFGTTDWFKMTFNQRKQLFALARKYGYVITKRSV